MLLVIFGAGAFPLGAQKSGNGDRRDAAVMALAL
jgi:hypothetical protein